MSDQSFETEPHGLCIGRCATGFLRVAKGDLINVERLLHTSNITISIQLYQPYPNRAVFIWNDTRRFAAQAHLDPVPLGQGLPAILRANAWGLGAVFLLVWGAIAKLRVKRVAVAVNVLPGLTVYGTDQCIPLGKLLPLPK